jgi:hypothetical protein
MPSPPPAKNSYGSVQTIERLAAARGSTAARPGDSRGRPSGARLTRPSGKMRSSSSRIRSPTGKLRLAKTLARSSRQAPMKLLRRSP